MTNPEKQNGDTDPFALFLANQKAADASNDHFEEQYFQFPDRHRVASAFGARVADSMDKHSLPNTPETRDTIARATTKLMFMFGDPEHPPEPTEQAIYHLCFGHVLTAESPQAGAHEIDTLADRLATIVDTDNLPPHWEHMTPAVRLGYTLANDAAQQQEL